MTRHIYSAALYLGLPVLAPLYAWKMAARPDYRAGFFQKLGLFLPRQTNKTIWIHAVSVGETMAALKLAKWLCRNQSQFRVMFSTTTPTGQQVARRELSPEANVFYFPFDFPGAAARAAHAVNPAALALVDTELWPNVIHSCARRGAPVIVVNGRISDRSFHRYSKIKPLLRPVLDDLSMILAQGAQDEKRFLDLGAPRDKVAVGGNLKFDQDTASVSLQEKDEIRKSLGISPDDKVALLGSVHNGEQEAIAAAAEVMKPGRKLVIAPRRIDNLDWIEKELASKGLSIIRRSVNSTMSMSDYKTAPVIDTFGELGRIYSVADIAFVGGSLIDHGGQNPLEPAAWGAPILFGPNMGNFAEASEALKKAGGAWSVSGKEEIKSRMEELLFDKKARDQAGQAARDVVKANTGATIAAAERIMALATRR